jgi:predicted house-cleaning noncanonical NTP pyrophosphatase (MazG superfamily)
VEFSLTDNEIKQDKRIGKVQDEIEEIFGSKYAEVIKNLLGVQKRMVMAAIFYMTFSLLLIAF